MSPSRRLLLIAVAGAIAGCANEPTTANVQVFTPPVQLAPGTTYRFERLPSQAADPRQGEVEALADAALVRAGLRRDEAAPALGVQVTTSIIQQPYGAPWGGGPSVGIGIGGGGGGGGIGIGLGIPIGGGGVRDTTRVDVQVRQLANGLVIYQAQASGGSGANPAALAQAALGGFPGGPAGARQVPLGTAVR